MKLINNVVKRQELMRIKVPFNGKASNIIEKGKLVRPRDLLFIREYKKVLDVYNLGLELGIRHEKASEYVSRIDGEFVTVGEVIAERIVRGGLAVKKVIATHDGVISLEKISNGILEILSEHVKEDVESQMIGRVVDVDHNEGITLEGSGIVFSVPHSNIKDTIGGVWEVIGDGTSIYSERDLTADYEGKIVFLGRYAYSALVNEAFKRGARAVAVFSIDYSEFASITQPVFVLGGFGNLAYDFRYQKLFSCMDDTFVSASFDTLVWVDKGQYLPKGGKEIVSGKVKVNDLVRIIDPARYSQVGRVVDDSNDDGYYTISLLEDERVLLPESVLEVVNF